MITLFERLPAQPPPATAINPVIDNASYNRSAAVKDWLARDGCRIAMAAASGRSICRPARRT